MEQLPFDCISFHQPTAKKSNESLPLEGFILYDEDGLSEKIADLDIELSTYRTKNNTLGTIVGNNSSNISIDGSSSSSLNYDWIKREWINGIEKIDKVYGRRFSDTAYYEGMALSWLRDVESTKNNSIDNLEKSPN